MGNKSINSIQISDRDAIYDVEVIYNPAGYVRVHCFEQSHEWPSEMPRMTPAEARELARQLIAAADLSEPQ